MTGPPDRVVLVAGASGLVGRACVRQFAMEHDVREVRALVRRAKVRFDSPRVLAIQVDHERLDGSSAAFHDVTHAVCALGTTMKQAGSREAFRRVDHDYPLALGRMALAAGVRHYLMVTAIGADRASRFLYNRVKGEVEQAIAGLGFNAVTIARPSLLVGPREAPRPAEVLFRALGWITPSRWKPVHAEQVAAALVAAARNDAPGVRMLENTDLRRAAPVG